MVARLLRRLGLPGMLAAAGLLAACATGGQASSKSNSYRVASAACEFYKYGPAQAFGPDQALKRGDPLTLVQREFGFSRVQLADGTQGYVATEDIAPAPPPSPPPRLAANRPSSAPRRHSSNPVLPSTDPLFDINDVPSPPLPSH